MLPKRRTVITGIGAVTPLGIGIEPSWQALCAGQPGVGLVSRFDATGFRCRVGGEVKDFHAEDFLPDKLARRMDRYQHFAIAAAEMALKDSGLSITDSNADRIGVIVGTGFGGIETMTKGHAMFMNGSRDEISPFYVPMLLVGMASGQVAMRFNARGPNQASVTACAAGTHAIGDAFRIIQRGDADAMFTGGAEAPIVPLIYHSLGTIGALSGRDDDPAKASRPFDLERDGFVMAEGSGVLMLEELEFALRRGARIYAEVIGYGATEDAYHVTSPAPGGEGAARCMKSALQDAGIEPADIDYINAHGTSTKLNDLTETQAIKSVFGELAHTVPISSNKSMLGHTLGASGAIEAVFTVLTMNHGVIPPTINLETSDPDCDLDYVPNVARKADVNTAMSNSFGFGGTNGVLILRKFQE